MTAKSKACGEQCDMGNGPSQCEAFKSEREILPRARLVASNATWAVSRVNARLSSQSERLQGMPCFKSWLPVPSRPCNDLANLRGQLSWCVHCICEGFNCMFLQSEYHQLHTRMRAAGHEMVAPSNMPESGAFSSNFFYSHHRDVRRFIPSSLHFNATQTP